MADEKKTSYNLSPEERALFRDAVKSVKPIKYDKISPTHKQEKIRKKTKQKEQNLQKEYYLSDYHPEPIDSDAYLLYCKPNLDPKIMKKLRNGNFPLQARLDLHGKTIAQAKTLLSSFIHFCQHDSVKHALIIHGKGMGSLTGEAKLKQFINHYLKQFPQVLAFCSAKNKDGGKGAVYVLLKSIDFSV